VTGAASRPRSRLPVRVPEGSESERTSRRDGPRTATRGRGDGGHGLRTRADASDPNPGVSRAARARSAPRARAVRGTSRRGRRRCAPRERRRDRWKSRRSLPLCRRAPFSFTTPALSLVNRAELPLPCGRLRRGSGDPCVASPALRPRVHHGGAAAPEKPAFADGGSACSVRTVGRKTRKLRPRAPSAVSISKEPPRRSSRAPC
jgi:hypothetical protein